MEAESTEFAEPTEIGDPAQLADLLHRLTKRLRRSQENRLSPLGLTPAQERALRMITRSSEPLRMTDLAERLGIVPRSVTTVVDALETAGLVRREIDPANRRAILLRLTPRGLAVRDELRSARRQAAEDLFAPLPADDRKALGDLLTRLELLTRADAARDTEGQPSEPHGTGEPPGAPHGTGGPPSAPHGTGGPR